MKGVFNNMKGLAIVLFTGFLLAFTGVFARALDQWYLPLQQVILRDLIVFLFTLILIRPQKKEYLLWRENALSPLAFGLTYAFTLLFFTLSILNTSFLVSISALYASSIITSLIIERFRYGYALRFSDLLSASLAILGIAFFALEGSSSGLNIGTIYGLLSGSFFSLANCLRKDMAMKISTVVIVRTQSGVGIIVYAFLNLVFGSWQVANWQPLSLLFVIGYALTYLAIAVLLVWSFKIMEFTKASLILSSELIFAAILGLAIYGEIPTLFHGLGSVLIMGACFIPQSVKGEAENKHICIYENK